MTPRVHQYIEEIGFWHHVSADLTLSKTRVRQVGVARGDIMKRLRDDGFSTPQIGRWLGRDPSTVNHWTKRSPVDNQP